MTAHSPHLRKAQAGASPSQMAALETFQPWPVAFHRWLLLYVHCTDGMVYAMSRIVCACSQGRRAASCWPAAVLLQPGQQLFVSVDILTFYLYETRCDHERSNPRPCTAPLTARPHTATAPLASHHLLTAAISRVLRSIRQLFDVHGAASASAWRWHCVVSAGNCTCW